MKDLQAILLFCFAACSVQQSAIGQNGNLHDWTWIDLTYPFSDQTLYWPNNPTGFTLDTLFEGHTGGGFYYSSYSFCAPEHGGTHMDSPIHFAEGRKTVDQVSLEQLIGDAVLIDVSAKALENRDYQFQVEDVLAWEEMHGRLPDDIILFFRTGYGKFYPDPLTYFGTEKRGDEAIPSLHFPGMHPELAQWLVENRKVKAVGSDNPSIDYGQSGDFRTHRILLGMNMPVFENVANLEKLPDTGIQIVALPMLIAGGSGGPLRIIAGIKE
jgi:kynurenine formamidase